MHLIYIVLSNGDCVSDLNAITQKQKGDSMTAFDKTDNVEYKMLGSLFCNPSSSIHSVFPLHRELGGQRVSNAFTENTHLWYDNRNFKESL